MTLMLMSMTLWADETITVSANSSDISEGLDLKVVAKLFAEAKNLEEFETMLNNPDSAFCNLDLNGDGQVDYLRVVETGEGNKRLIVLQAILAKDIYQDVASIYVEKDESDQVSVQVIGDEYVYGANYIIEPVYVYRPLIYDWFWSPAWYAWTSPWYWGYYPGWRYVHACWAHDWYWHHCYAFHHHHHWCSFRPGRTVRSGYHELHHGVSHRDLAAAHPERSFSSRNAGMVNAREIRNTASARGRAVAGSERSAISASRGAATTSAPVSSRTYGSAHTAATRSEAVSRSGGSSRSTSTAAGPARTAGTATTTRSTSASTSTRSTSTATATRSTSTASTRSTSTASTTRSTGASTRSTSSSHQPARSISSSSSSYGGASRSSGSSTRSSGSYSGSSTRSGGSYGGGSRSGGGGYSGGGSSRGGGGASSGGGSRRR